MSSSSPISSYVQSMIENDASNNISEEEVFEITTKATSSSNVYSGFAELANALERLRKRKTDDGNVFGEKSARLLDLFSFGTFDEYYHQQQQNEQQSLKVILNEKQEEKLKQLSVASLSYETKVLSYEILMQQLHLNSVRELEDFLIEKVISPGIVKGQMNQELSVFEVFSAIGRDPRQEKWESGKDVGDCERVEENVRRRFERHRKSNSGDEDGFGDGRSEEGRGDEEARGGGKESERERGWRRRRSGGIEEEVDVAIKEESGSAGGTKRKK